MSGSNLAEEMSVVTARENLYKQSGKMGLNGELVVWNPHCRWCPAVVEVFPGATSAVGVSWAVARLGCPVAHAGRGAGL